MSERGSDDYLTAEQKVFIAAQLDEELEEEWNEEELTRSQPTEDDPIP